MATTKKTTKKTASEEAALKRKLSDKLKEVEEEIEETEEELEDEEVEEIVEDEDIEEVEEDEEEDEEEVDEDIEEVEEKSSNVVKFEQPKSTADYLKNINVDLNNIIIERNTNDLEVMSLKSDIFQSNATFQVVCCQSGYIAHLTALKNQELQNISNMDADLYNFKNNLYKHVHKHITSSSNGRMGFEEWKKITSYFDVETLLYGIYCQTFPYQNNFQTRCNKPDCGAETSVMVNNETLVEIRGDASDTYSKLQEIINSNNMNQLIEESLVHKVKRVCLNESKIIFDLIIPSVYDYLEGTLKGVNPQFMNDYSDSIGLNLFVDKIYLPNIPALKATGKLSYIPQTDKTGKIMTIADLSFNDNIQLSDEITKFTDKYKISYSIRGVRCKECGDIMDDIPVSMEDVLFRRIRLGKQENEQ